MKRLVVLMALAGCVAVADPPEGTGKIEVFGGGGFSGYSRTTVYADDRVVTETAGPGGQSAKRNARRVDGAYAAAAAVLAAEGRKAKAAMEDSDEICMDYGSDSVVAEPAVGGFATATAECPDPALLALQQQVLAALAAK